MAASLSLTQLSSGNPVYDKYYRQVDPSGSGRVAAADAALFLKRSGLADLVLGKIWDLADSERQGSLNKQQFFVALRLVACAQNGLEVALKSLNAAVPPPKFHDTNSPLLPGSVPVDCPWVVKTEEKLKFDAIFDSLSPVGGMLSGEKVKPVLLNSKLPVDVLGRVWELSDIDRDGMLDRDEFAVAMYLVYRALEAEAVPMALPPSLIPPSKRKKPSASPVMPLLPSPPSLKERRPSHSGGTKTQPNKPAAPQWVVSPADKAKYDELFAKTDGDMDGLVSGPEVRDIFLKTGLPSATLARIWELCDIADLGKLTKEQFALALHLINQKLSKGMDPPQALSPEMIPPSDRLRQNNAISCQAADFSAIKELDSLSNEIADLQREKGSVEQDIREKEESIQQRTSEVQDLQDEVERESGELRRLQSERQEVQDVLERLEEQKRSLEEQLGLIRQQCTQESQLIQSLQAEHVEQEQQIGDYEEELCRAREELLRLQEEAQALGEKVESARTQLCPLQDAVNKSHSQLSQVQERLGELQEEERSVTAQLGWKACFEEQPPLVNGTSHAEEPPQEESPPKQQQEEEEEEEEKVEKKKEEEVEEQEAVAAAVVVAATEEVQIPTDEPKELRVTEEQEEQQEAGPEEQGSKNDPLDDLYTSAKSSVWPQESAESGSSPPAEGKDGEETEETEEPSNSSKPSTPKVGSPVPEQTDEPPQRAPTPPQTAPTPAQTTPTPPQTAPTPPLQAPTPPQLAAASPPGIDFFQSDPFTDSDPFKDDPFSKVDVPDPFGADPFKGSDPFAADFFAPSASSAPFSSADPFGSADLFGAPSGLADADPFGSQPSQPAAADPFQTPAGAAAGPDPFGSGLGGSSEPDPFGGKADPVAEDDPFSVQPSAGPDPFSSTLAATDVSVDASPVPNDPFAPGGTAVSTSSDSDPFAAVFGNESFGGGFADFSALAKSNGDDPFGSSSANNKNLFKEDSQPGSPDVPPALPPKTGTPTRPPPPPPGKRSNIYRSESSDSFQRRAPFTPQGSGDFSSPPASDAVPDPFAPTSHGQAPRDPERFASFDKYPTEEDMIEWAKRESEREERERVARLTQQEQEDLELAIALSKSELS